MTRTITSAVDPVSTDVVFQRAGKGLPCWMTSDSGIRREATARTLDGRHTHNTG